MRALRARRDAWPRASASPSGANNPRYPDRERLLREFQLANTRQRRREVYAQHRHLIDDVPLSDQERDVLLCFYRDGQTLAQIARAHDRSASRISQIKARALRKVAYWPGSPAVK